MEREFSFLISLKSPFSLASIRALLKPLAPSRHHSEERGHPCFRPLLGQKKYGDKPLTKTIQDVVLT